MSFAPPPVVPAAASDRLLVELALGARDLRAIGPVLRHLVARPDTGLFAEEIVARTRGMTETLALRLLRSGGERSGESQPAGLMGRLCDHEGLLVHIHALALEGQITAGLAARGIDSILPPLLQTRMASGHAETAAQAMALLAAQTRFVRGQQRMELDFAELPGDLLHDVLRIMADNAGAEAAAAIDQVRGGYDERKSRLALLAQVGLALGDSFLTALDPAQAGFALFVTAVSLVTGQDRDRVVIAASRGQEARLVLMLAMAGLAPAAREATLYCLHPDAVVAPEWLAVDGHDAAALLHEASRT